MSNIKYSILLFLLIIYLLYHHKPELFDDSLNKHLPYLTITVSAFASYYLVLLYKNKNT